MRTKLYCVKLVYALHEWGSNFKWDDSFKKEEDIVLLFAFGEQLARNCDLINKLLYQKKNKKYRNLKVETKQWFNYSEKKKKQWFMCSLFFSFFFLGLCLAQSQ